MALIAESKGFNSPDDDGTDCTTLTSSVWGSEAPKTHLVFGQGNGTNSIYTNIKNSIGWSDGTDNVAIGVGSQNNSATTVCNRTHQTSYNIYPLSNNGGIYESAVQSSYNASPPKICHNWSNSANDGYNYFLMALGGDDVENISIDQIQTKTSTGLQSYTGPGFKPDFLICLGVASLSTLPYADAHMVCQFGMSDGSTDAGYYNASIDGQGVQSKTYSVQSSNFIHVLDGNANDQVVAGVKSFDSNGYTLNYTDVSSAMRVTVIAVKGPAAKVIATTQPTSNTTNDLNAGFVPKAGICVGSMKTASETGSNHNRFSIGTWDEQNNMDSGGWMDEHGQSTTDVDRYISNTHSIVNYNHSQSVVGKATVAANGNGIRETWTNTDGSEYKHAWLLLGDKPEDPVSTLNPAFMLFLE